MEATTLKQLQIIVNNARDITDAQLTVLFLLNEETNKFEFKVIDQKNTSTLQTAIEEAKKFAPDFNLLIYGFPADINPYGKKIVDSKKHSITDLYGAVENMIPKIAVIAGQKILNIKNVAAFPVIINEKVKGIIAYLSKKEPEEKDIKVMQAFTDQLMLLIENIQISESLYEKLKEETFKLGKERNNLDSKVKERTMKLDNSRSALLYMLKDIDKTNKELASAKEYTDNIIKSMIDTLIVVNSNAIIQKVNQSTLNLLGYEEDELTGKPLGIILKEEAIFKGTEIEDLVKKVCVSNVEKTYLTKDGREIPVLFSGSVMRNDKGTISGVVCVASDDTERKQAEETLRRKDEHYKAMIENIFKFIPEGVLVFTESMSLLKQNKAFGDVIRKYAPMLGYTEDELAQKIIEQLSSEIPGGEKTEIRISKKSQ